MSVFQKLGNEVTQIGACFTENNAAGYVYDRDVAYLPGGGGKVHGNLHFRFQNSIVTRKHAAGLPKPVDI